MKEEIQNESAQTQYSQREGRMFSFLIPVLEAIKVVMASVASVVFFGFACVTLAGSAVALAVCTPVFFIFSPILVPATIATTLLATGLGAGTTLGVTAMGLLMRLIKNPGKEGASSSLAAQPSFIQSLLEMPNSIMRLISLPGLGKKSKGRGKSKGGKKSKDKKGKSKRGKGKKSKSKGKKSKSKGKDKDKESKGKGLFGRSSRKGSSDDED